MPSSVSGKRALTRLFLLSAALLILAPEIAYADDCPPGTVKIGEKKTETADAIIVQPLCKRIPAVAPQPQAANPAAAVAFCKAKLQVAADERAIGQMNFGNNVESFEMFADVAKAQKAEFQGKVLGALIDQGLEATTIAARSAKSLNTVNVYAAIDQFRKNGMKNEAILTALHVIAETKDKPAMAHAYENLVQLVQSAKEGYDTGKDIAEDSKNAQLRLLLGVLNVAQGNPELGVAVTTADFGESLAYLGYISNKVDGLTHVTEQQLLLLNSLISRTRDDVKKLQQAKLEWTTANTTASAPDCHP
jgi:hypothetical protein